MVRSHLGFSRFSSGSVMSSMLKKKVARDPKLRKQSTAAVCIAHGKIFLAYRSARMKGWVLRQVSGRNLTMLTNSDMFAVSERGYKSTWGQ